jgi:hypothetical protein
MNIQNHAELADRKWAMAQAIRDSKPRGRDLSDEQKIMVKHLENMALEHIRTAMVVPAHVRFIRQEKS